MARLYKIVISDAFFWRILQSKHTDGEPNWNVFVISGNDELGIVEIIIHDLAVCPSLREPRINIAPDHSVILALRVLTPYSLNNANGVSQWNKLIAGLMPFFTISAMTSS